MSVRLLVWVLLAVGCTSSSSVECAFGTCPAGDACDVVHGRCVLPDQLTSCTSHGDGDSCAAGQAPGVCVDGICLAKGCGDFRVDGSEECDGDMFVHGAKDCVDIGYYDAGPISCRADCTIDDSACSRKCGDQVKDSEEVCEYSIAGSDTTCNQLGFYNAAPAPCSLFCTYNIAQCHGYCGDNVINGPELCDGTQPLPSSLSCLDDGFDSGTLACGAGCFADTSACHHLGLYGAVTFTTALYGVWQASPTDGFVTSQTTSASGVLLRWNGTTYTPLATPAGGPFYSIHGTSATNVFAVGYNRISHFDGTSVTDTAISTADFRAVFARTPTDAFAVGINSSSAGLIYRYNGSTWSPMTSNTSSPLLGVWAAASNDAWAVGGNGVLDHFTGSWATVTSPVTSVLRSVWGSSSSDVFAVGDSGIILHYGGGSWQKMTSPTSSHLFSVFGSASDDVFAVGSSVLLHYDGVRWVSLLDVASSVFAGSAYDRTHATVADAFHVSTWQGAGWAIPFMTVNPTALWGTAETNLYAINQGAVLHYDGTTWNTATTGTALETIWGSGANDIFAGGDAGEMHHYNGAWSATTVGSGVVQAIGGTSSSNVWAFEDTEEVFRWNGTSWSPAADPGTTVRAVWGVPGTNELFALGGGLILHFDGQSWSDTGVAATDPSSVWGTSATNVYVTDFDHLWHYDGSTWTKVVVPNPLGASLTNVKGVAADDIFAVGERIMLHYDGVAWTPIRLPVTMNVLGLMPFVHDVFTTSSSSRIDDLVRACATCGL